MRFIAPLWLLFDVLLGLVLAGIVFPLAVVLLPADWRGSRLALAISLAAVVSASLLRRRLVTGRPRGPANAGNSTR